MSEVPFMQLYVGDYLADTRHLTTEQHGAYLLLLMTMWKAGGKLPNDPAKLARIAGVSLRRWHLIWPEIAAFFDAADGFVTQNRLVREYRKAVSKREKRCASGGLGGKAKALNAKGGALANATVSPKHSSEPESEAEKKEKNPPTPQGGLVAFEPSSCEFEKVWPHYPRRVGKAAAHRAWLKARKRAGYDEIAGPLKACIRAWRNTPPDKIPHFATWLNRDGWLDDPGHASNRARTGREDVESLSRITAADDVASLFADIPLRIVK
jgi:uncharacterized protein YdaU (DUF1376 family)